jgi:hypothetical protein
MRVDLAPSLTHEGAAAVVQEPEAEDRPARVQIDLQLGVFLEDGRGGLCQPATEPKQVVGEERETFAPAAAVEAGELRVAMEVEDLSGCEGSPGEILDVLDHAALPERGSCVILEIG